MIEPREVVITGIGIASPIGIGNEAVWKSLSEGRSGVRPLTIVDTGGLPVPFGGEVPDFDPKDHVRPRKSLKVMNRDIQLGVAAANQALADAGWETGATDPERFGVVFGCDFLHLDVEEMAPLYQACKSGGTFRFDVWGQLAPRELFPLFLLKYLPNMPACHVAITQDARGPSNTLCSGEVSSLLAIDEARRVIERDAADIMLCGGTGTRLHPTLLVRTGLAQYSRRSEDPASACRPFDARRDGLVNGEGAAVFVIESADHARRRGARPLARITGGSSAFGASRNGHGGTHRAAIVSAIERTLREADTEPSAISHVNAHGLSTTEQDAVEAQAIHHVLGNVPVTAPKSYFGNLGAGTGAVEMAASLLGLLHREVPPTLNYDEADQNCPVQVVQREPLPLPAETQRALLLNQAPGGQVAALLIETVD